MVQSVCTPTTPQAENDYPHLTHKAINIAIPFLEDLDSLKLKGKLKELVDEASAKGSTPWPQFINQWHKKHLKVTTKASPSVGDILCNVNHYWKHGDYT